MITFWIIAAALLVLALALLATALRSRQRTPDASQRNLALLKEQLRQADAELAAGSIGAEQHALARTEIERRVLEEESVAVAPEHAGSTKATLVLVTLAVPVLALALYGVLGNPRALQPESLAQQPTQQDIEQLVAKLAERMDKQPPGRVEDAEGWIMLGRTYAALQRFDQASRAFGKALALTPKNAQLLADQADVLAMQNGQDLSGEPLRLVEQALQIEPNNLKALALAGSAAYDRRDLDAALNYWRQAQALAPPDSEFAKGMARNLDELRAQAAQKPGAAGGAMLNGRVSVAPALAARIAPDDTVFVFARAADGPRMPLAIVKARGADLPLRFTLDDSQAMSPQMKLSAFDSVLVEVRVSKSGNAAPQSGDLEGQVGPLPNRSAAIELVIDRVRP